MKNIHIKNTLNYFSCFIKIILFLSITSITFANENKIGSVTELNGAIVAINDKLEERDLLIHDPIFLNEEIFVTQGSSATIQFNDSTAIIMKELTSINVSEFENSKNNPKLKAELLKGKIVIESGSIAKKDDGEMIVNITTSSLGLRGTRIDVDLKPDGKSNISLAEDSFGNVGSIDVTSGGQISNIISTEQVLEISENSEATSRDKSEDEKEIEKSVSETLIQSSKIDENEIDNIKSSKNSTIPENELLNLKQKLHFHQDENLRLSHELSNSQKKYKLIKEQLNEIENEKSQISQKIEDLTDSLSKTKIIANVFDQKDVNSNRNTSNNSNKIDLEKEIKNIFIKSK